MIKNLRRRSRLFLLLLFCAIASSAQQKSQPPRKPKLVLAIVVDQFRYDYLLRFRGDYQGGLARLLAQGAVFADARYIHFPTVTAVGHSTFMSGATPSISGIIANTWLDREENAQVTSVSDKSTTLLGGPPGVQGSSPHRLLVSTIGDELKMSGQHSKVIGISMKDRSAILPVGHMADAAYWFDPDSQHFVSSSYYMKQLPAWVAKINNDRPAYKYLGVEWTPVGAKAGDRPFCTMKAGAELRFCGSIENTPFGNELVEEFVEKAIEEEKLGSHEGTDVLAVSFSANDYVGHQLGPDAPEVRDISRRTDILLGKLFDFVNGHVGAGNTLVVFTADHGVVPVPKVNNDRKMPGGWLSTSDYAAKIATQLSAKFGKGDWFSFDADGFLYLNYSTVTRNNADRLEVRRFAAEVARGLPHVARVFTYDDLLRGTAPADWPGRAAQLGFYGPRSADLVLLPEPYYIFSTAPGTTHQTPYSYDNHVPLIFYGPGIQGGLHYEAVTINDVAPTLAAILGIETPSGASGRILAEILE
ncbi:MAG TPA: alkaline phosphatase family protein [Candidatus Sulfotelmatobacter sp.]|nr:alkaline phosphatase family protein [Candidatus Sulfotelmatobacter sp.]